MPNFGQYGLSAFGSVACETWSNHNRFQVVFCVEHAYVHCINGLLFCRGRRDTRSERKVEEHMTVERGRIK